MLEVEKDGVQPGTQIGEDSNNVNGMEEDTAAGLRARRKYVNKHIRSAQGTSLIYDRVDITVLPLLFLGLLVFQLDRMNLASALTDGFAKQIGVNQSTINLGNQLMFLGIVVLEIPANMILQRV